MSVPRPAIILVMGGGGAKGIVHIGILRAIEAAGLRVDAVVGTSIGAVWAALFSLYVGITFRGDPNAQRKAIEALEQVALSLNFLDFVDPTLRGTGHLKGERFESWLKTMLWDNTPPNPQPLTFGALPFELILTTTDAVTGDSVTCSREATPGLSIPIAVRASMALPGAFRERPLEVPDGSGGVRLVAGWDGGLTGNCRFDLAYRLAPERPIVASSLTYHGAPIILRRRWWWPRPPMTEIRDRAIDLLLRHCERVLYESLIDASRRVLLLYPPLSGITTIDFLIPPERRKEAIDAAEKYTLPELQRFGKRAGAW